MTKSDSAQDEASKSSVSWDLDPSLIPFLAICLSIGVFVASAPGWAACNPENSYCYRPQDDPVACCVWALMIVIESQRILPPALRLWTHSGELHPARFGQIIITRAPTYLIRSVGALYSGFYLGSLFWCLDANMVLSAKAETALFEVVDGIFLLGLFVLYYAYPDYFVDDPDVRIVARGTQTSSQPTKIQLGTQKEYEAMLERYGFAQTLLEGATFVGAFITLTMHPWGSVPINFADPFPYCFVLVIVACLWEQRQESYCQFWVYARVQDGMLWRAAFFARALTWITVVMGLVLPKLPEVTLFGISVRRDALILPITAALNLFCVYKKRRMKVSIVYVEEGDTEKIV